MNNRNSRTAQVHYRVAYILFFACLLFGNRASFAQTTKYAWFTDTHIGFTNADSDLTVCTNNVNARGEASFVIVTGDVSDLGSDLQLRKAKTILNKLQVPYYSIPGNHDCTWSESYCETFNELFRDDKFVFDTNGIRHIGLNSGIAWQGYDGHYTPEDLHWLDSVVTATPGNEKIFFYTHHPLDATIDNWFKAVNILRKKNIQVVLCGHGHMIKKMSVANIPMFMNRPVMSKRMPTGYTVVQATPDSLFLTEITGDTVSQVWGSCATNQKINVPKIDSTQFFNYSAQLHWKKDLRTSVPAGITVFENKLYVATTAGILYCYNTEGKELWHFNANGTLMSGPTIALGVVAVVTHDGDIYTLRAETGELIQSIGLGEKITSRVIAVKTNFRDEDTYGLLMGTVSGKMIFYDMFSLNPIWENTSAGEMVQDKPLIVNDRIIYGSRDGNLYCIDIKTGTLNWKWASGGDFVNAPAVCAPVTDGNNVYIVSPDKSVTCIDLLLGKAVWTKKDYNAYESIGISADMKRIFIKSAQNKFVIIAAKDGKLVKDLDGKFGGDLSPSEPFEFNGSIIFGAKNGNVYQLKNNLIAPVLFMGTARIRNIVPLNENTLAAINMDGTIIVFSLI
jgi:outer membrane protein assembly factor BamB/predicted phosphodiesterase